MDIPLWKFRMRMVRFLRGASFFALLPVVGGGCGSAVDSDFVPSIQQPAAQAAFTLLAPVRRVGGA